MRLPSPSKSASVPSSSPKTGVYWEAENLTAFPSGCILLDLVLGGGYCEDRMINIVGDKSTGKTLLGIEAAANFIRKYPTGLVRVLDAEAAFDKEYATTLGLPAEQTEMAQNPPTKKVKEPTDIETVEEWYADIIRTIALAKRKKRKVLYVLDSMDALSDKAEQNREIDDGTYGTKAKKVSELFRRVIRALKRSTVTLLIISQIRDKMDAVAFGKKHSRSGGKALDFYAYQVIWLAHIGKLSVAKKRNRTYGVQIKASCEKNKLGPPFRVCEFPIFFGYGVENVVANLEYLIEEKKYKLAGISSEEKAKDFVKRVRTISDEFYDRLQGRTTEAVRKVWAEIQSEVAPTRRKYR